MRPELIMKIQWQISSLKNITQYITIIDCYAITFMLMTTCISIKAWEFFLRAKKSCV